MLMTPKDTCKYLGICRTTLWKWETERGLPVHRIGGKAYCYKDEIDAWVKKGGESCDY